MGNIKFKKSFFGYWESSETALGKILKESSLTEVLLNPGIGRLRKEAIVALYSVADQQSLGGWSWR